MACVSYFFSVPPSVLPSHVGSDIDLLVEFLPGKKIGLFEYAGMRIELEGLLQRKVDLVSKRGLKPLIREDVLSQTWKVYAA
jgi:predicted nucleotidyltransferase